MRYKAASGLEPRVTRCSELQAAKTYRARRRRRSLDVPTYIAYRGRRSTPTPSLLLSVGDGQRRCTSGNDPARAMRSWPSNSEGGRRLRATTMTPRLLASLQPLQLASRLPKQARAQQWYLQVSGIVSWRRRTTAESASLGVRRGCSALDRDGWKCRKVRKIRTPGSRPRQTLRRRRRNVYELGEFANAMPSICPLCQDSERESVTGETSPPVRAWRAFVAARAAE